MDIMMKVCYEGIYFSAQHISDPESDSSWAAHTKVILWAMGANQKSWAHL